MEILNLLQRARSGDQEALQQLLARSKRTLSLEADRRLGEKLRSRMHVSDVLQSTYIDIVHSIESFAGASEEDFVHWVLRVLENNIKNRARYYRALKRDPGSDGDGVDVYAVPVPSADPTPSAEVTVTDELLSIGKALAKLPPDYRQVLQMHLGGQADHKTIAKVMGRSEGASRVLLARARAALQAELERFNNEVP